MARTEFDLEPESAVRTLLIGLLRYKLYDTYTDALVYVTGTSTYTVTKTVTTDAGGSFCIGQKETLPYWHFIEGVNYTLTGTTLTWFGEDIPDNGTTFYITYYYDYTTGGWHSIRNIQPIYTEVAVTVPIVTVSTWIKSAKPLNLGNRINSTDIGYLYNMGVKFNVVIPRAFSTAPTIKQIFGNWDSEVTYIQKTRDEIEQILLTHISRSSMDDTYKTAWNRSYKVLNYLPGATDEPRFNPSKNTIEGSKLCTIDYVAEILGTLYPKV